MQKLLNNPALRLLLLAVGVAALLYMPTREFLKLTFMFGIPFVFVRVFMMKQQERGALWWISFIILMFVAGSYAYMLTNLPERIEIRRIVSEGGALVAEGKYTEAITEYSKLQELDREEKMKEKIALAEYEQKADLDLQTARQLLDQGYSKEAQQILEDIPGNTRAGREARKLMDTIDKEEN